ncbi:unnamed protein product [Ilex paraguariensis]|uniref:G domain-containing protein n=1 Tax=Ilex paraguariensis TaxID=185542 RepID=A0ABC8R7L2_9AQUA
MSNSWFMVKASRSCGVQTEEEVISREPTLLVMVVGVPNVGKSALINSIHQIASSRFPVQEKIKRATVGPLPGVTQDIAGYKIDLPNLIIMEMYGAIDNEVANAFLPFGGIIRALLKKHGAEISFEIEYKESMFVISSSAIAHHPSIYVLDSPGVLVPSIPNIETGLKLALAGSVKDSVVGEERIAQYLLAVLNTRSTPLHWRHLNGRGTEVLKCESDDKKEYNLRDLLPKRRKPQSNSDVHYIEDIVTEVQRALYTPLSEFNGSLENESDLESLIEQQFEALQKALKIPHKASEARTMVSKKFLTLFRIGKLGPFILDDVPDASNSLS